MKKKPIESILGSLIVAAAAALGSVDRWFFEALDPGDLDASDPPGAGLSR
jgi:hypothetical protein